METVQKKDNFNQALWLAISYTCSMLVGIVSSVILSRYFDKAQYGTYKQIINIYNLLLTVFLAGLPAVFTYFLPRYSTKQGKYIVKIVHRILFFLGLIFSVALFFSSDFLSTVLNNPELSTGLKIFSFFPLFTLPTIGVEGIYTVNKNTRFVAFYNIATRLTMLICIVFPVVFIKNDFRYALYGWGIASFVAFVIAMIAKNKVYKQYVSETVNSILPLILQYSVPLMLASLVGMLFSFANQFFISRYCGTESFAEYSNGQMTLPFAVIFIAPVRSILTPIFSKASQTENYYYATNTLYESIKKIAIIMTPLVVYCFVTSKDIMVFLYGEQYIASHVYFKMAIFYNYIEIFVFSSLLSAIGKSKSIFYINLISVVVLWGCDYLVKLLGFTNPYLFALLYIIVNIFANYLAPGIVLRQNGIRVLDENVIKVVSTISIHSVIVGIIVYILKTSLYADFPLLIKLICSFVIFYLILMTSSKVLHIDYIDPLLRYFKSNNSH